MFDKETKVIAFISMMLVMGPALAMPEGFQEGRHLFEIHDGSFTGYRSGLTEVTRLDGVKLEAHVWHIPETARSGVYIYEDGQCVTTDGACLPLIPGDVERVYQYNTGIVEAVLCVQRDSWGGCEVTEDATLYDFEVGAPPPPEPAEPWVPEVTFAFPHIWSSYDGTIGVNVPTGSEHIDRAEVKYYSPGGGVVTVIRTPVCDAQCIIYTGYCPSEVVDYEVIIHGVDGQSVTTGRDPDYHKIYGCQ